MDGECQLHKDIEKKFRPSNLILGQVDFINCLPINLPLELNEVSIDAEIIKGVPSKLNNLILSEQVDIAPVSSYAYISNKNKLTPIGNLCIASNGPADSVLLFSHFPIEELDGAKIALSSASATSNKLLEILFKGFLKVKAELCIPEQGSNEPIASLVSREYSALLLIGDNALLEYSKMPRDLFIYDLGSLWKKYTGLPMVFGIWVVRNEAFKSHQEKIYDIANKLMTSKELGLGSMFDRVVKKAQEKVLISKDFYSMYFQHLSYDLTSDFIKGLNTFEEYCNKLTKPTPILS